MRSSVPDGSLFPGQNRAPPQGTIAMILACSYHCWSPKGDCGLRESRGMSVWLSFPPWTLRTWCPVATQERFVAQCSWYHSSSGTFSSSSPRQPTSSQRGNACSSPWYALVPRPTAEANLEVLASSHRSCRTRAQPALTQLAGSWWETRAPHSELLEERVSSNGVGAW